MGKWKLLLGSDPAASIGLWTGVKKRLCSMLLRISRTRITSSIAGVGITEESRSIGLQERLSNLKIKTCKVEYRPVIVYCFDTRNYLNLACFLLEDGAGDELSSSFLFLRSIMACIAGVGFCSDSSSLADLGRSFFSVELFFLATAVVLL